MGGDTHSLKQFALDLQYTVVSQPTCPPQGRKAAVFRITSSATVSVSPNKNSCCIFIPRHGRIHIGSDYAGQSIIGAKIVEESDSCLESVAKTKGF